MLVPRLLRLAVWIPRIVFELVALSEAIRGRIDPVHHYQAGEEERRHWLREEAVELFP